MAVHQDSEILQGSDLYFFTPSQMAKEQLFYFTSIGHFYCDFGYQVIREDYGNFLLMLIQHGRMEIKTENKRFTAGEGDIAFIDCHKPHAYKAIGSVEFLWVHFDGSNTAWMHTEITEHIYMHPVFHMDDNREIEKLIKDIIYQMRYKRLSTEYEDSLLVYRMLISLTNGNTGKWEHIESQKDQAIKIAIRYIDENLDQNITTRMIADHVGLSESHFNRKFRQAMSNSPKEYIIRKRLNEAKLLLKTSSLPVREIAEKVGFNSESHFTNTFTAQNGLSPRAFREFPI